MTKITKKTETDIFFLKGDVAKLIFHAVTTDSRLSI